MLWLLEIQLSLSVSLKSRSLMKILIVHMRYQPDNTGTAPLITQLAQDLVKSGSDVTVIASLPHYGRTTIHPDYVDYDGYFHRITRLLDGRIWVYVRSQQERLDRNEQLLPVGY